jgi:hypothetical protein
MMRMISGNVDEYLVFVRCSSRFEVQQDLLYSFLLELRREFTIGLVKFKLAIFYHSQEILGEECVVPEIGREAVLDILSDGVDRRS